MELSVLRKTRGTDAGLYDREAGRYLVRFLDKLGKGTFTEAFIGEDGHAWLLTSTKGHHVDYAKEILAMLHHVSNPHIPKMENYGDAFDPKNRSHVNVYRSKIYNAPLSKQDAPIAWAQYQLISKCYKEWNAKMASSYGWGKRAMSGYEQNLGIVECYAATPGHDSVVLEALNDLMDMAMNYGAHYTFEFSPRNLASDENGRLVFLDVLFNMEALREIQNMRMR